MKVKASEHIDGQTKHLLLAIFENDLSWSEECNCECVLYECNLCQNFCSFQQISKHCDGRVEVVARPTRTTFDLIGSIHINNSNIHDMKKEIQTK